MKKINLIGLAVVVISGLVFLSSAFANTPTKTLIVSTNPTQGQYASIQAAVDAAQPGYTVLVLPGQYSIDE